MIATILWGVAMLDEAAVEENGDLALDYLCGDAEAVGDGGDFVAGIGGDEAQDNALHGIQTLDVLHVDHLLRSVEN